MNKFHKWDIVEIDAKRPSVGYFVSANEKEVTLSSLKMSGKIPDVNLFCAIIGDIRLIKCSHERKK